MKEIKIYTTEACDYCKQMKELLNKENVEFTDLIAKDNQLEWQQIIKLTGLATFPTIVVGDEYYIPGRDFGSPEQIVNHLKNYKPDEDNFSIDLKLMQAFKTMAFSMNQASSRIIQQLNELKNKKDEHKSTS